MNERQLGEGTVRFLRRICVAAGIVLAAVSLLANRLGVSVSDGLSRNQIVIAVGGLILIGAGILGRRFPRVWRGAALVLLNIILVLLVLDLISLVLLKMLDGASFEILQRKREQGNLEMVQHNTLQGRYEPYVVWKADPDLYAEGLRVSEEGYRITPGIVEEEGAFTVFLLGGSAMWGAGVDDSCTIAAFLAGRLETTAGDGFRILNMGQIAFSSTQEMIELALQLRNGSIPDLVVFYDGFNDVWGAYANGFAGGHHSQAQVAARVEGRSPEFRPRPALEILIRNTNIWLLMESVRRRARKDTFDTGDLITYRTMGVDAESLAEDVVSTYLGNCRVAEALGEAYGFDCLFIWQPSVWLGEKPLTEFEQIVHAGGFEAFQGGGDPAFKELLEITYRIYEDSIETRNGYHSFSGLFDGVEEELYCDYSGAHVNSLANSMIAEEIASLMSLTVSDPARSFPTED